MGSFVVFAVNGLVWLTAGGVIIWGNLHVLAHFFLGWPLEAPGPLLSWLAVVTAAQVAVEWSWQGLAAAVRDP